MKKILICCFLFVSQASLFAQKQGKQYQFYTDLTQVKDDKVAVSVVVPKVKVDEIEYQMPKIVPGTYAIYNFGRFLSEFKAFDEQGKELPVKILDQNRWSISNAKKLYKITYLVEDSFDTKQENFIFEPAGTNIEEDKNFVINTFGFFGYLKGMKNSPFEVNIKRPQSFYGSTAMKLVSSKDNIDKFAIDNYFNLADMPIMYCKPDTTSLMLGGAEVLVSVYSPTGKLKSSEVMNEIKPIMLAQKDYLGGKLPVKKYAFLIYLNVGIGGSQSAGALEHSYSTQFFLVENDIKRLAQTVKNVAAHEFFHIVTPLNIHSEEIGDYDFINPKMSKHLWLYEGCTEYAAQHVQVKHNLMTIPAFLADITNKMRGADRYKQDLSFTEMSLGCLDKYENQYGNVYQKGALIGMCLDIKLRSLSAGKYGTQELMKDLAKKYGTKSFKDAELFDVIAQLTYPEIRTFFTDYVEGTKPLPFAQYLTMAGINYEETSTVKSTLSGISQQAVQITGDGRLAIANATGLDDFGKALGYQNGDVIMKFNGQDLNLQTVQEILGKFRSTAKAGDDTEVIVSRKDEKGEAKDVVLKAKVIEKEMPVKHKLSVNEKATPEQIALRKAWINQ